MSDVLHLRELFNQHHRQAREQPGMTLTQLAGRCRYIFQHESFGFVMYTGLPDDQVDAAIEEEIAHFRQLGIGFEWKHFDYDQPADLKARLLARGFVPEEPEAVMVLSIADAPDELKQPIKHDVRKVTDGAGLADADAVALAVWQDEASRRGSQTPVTDRYRAMLEQSPDSVSLYVGYVDGQPACYGRMDFLPDNPFAGIWEGATLPQFRQRGLYRALLAARLQEAQIRGCEYLNVDARQNTSMPILQRLGFVTIGYATALNWTPDA